MARIKSRPTTLLSQGVGMGVPGGVALKNGYSAGGPQPPLPSYLTTAGPGGFLPTAAPGVSQPPSVGAPPQVPANLYAPTQQVSIITEGR
jgi:hypothetical protein